MATLQQESSQRIESVQGQGHVDHLMEPATQSAIGKQAGCDLSFTPGITIQETEAEVILSIETGGINIRDLDLKVSEEAVFIKGKRRFEFSDEYRGILCAEFHYCQFQQVIPLPALIQNGEIRAVCADGMLCLTMPKFENAKHRVVSINLPETLQN